MRPFDEFLFDAFESRFKVRPVRIGKTDRVVVGDETISFRRLRRRIWAARAAGLPTVMAVIVRENASPEPPPHDAHDAILTLAENTHRSPNHAGTGESYRILTSVYRCSIM